MVAAGAVSAAYAGSLAWVLGLQADTDWQRIAERQPVDEAIQLLRLNHDRLTDRLGKTWDGYERVAGEYSVVADGAYALNTRLRGLDQRVAEVEALAWTIPTRMDLPEVGTLVKPGSGAPRPLTSAPTAGTVGPARPAATAAPRTPPPAVAVVEPAPPPPAAVAPRPALPAPPPANSKTGASGA